MKEQVYVHLRMCACYKRVCMSKSTCICVCMYVFESNKMCVRACCGYWNLAVSYLRRHDLVAAKHNTCDHAAAPAALTNERPTILWGVSRLMAAAAAHSPADDLAPPSESDRKVYYKTTTIRGKR